MIGIPLTTIAYLLANVGYFAVMSKEEVLLSHAVAVVGDLVLFSKNGPFLFYLHAFRL